MEDNFTIRDLISAFFRQYKIFRTVFLLCVVAGILAIIFSTTLYQASGSLLVKFGANANAGVNRTDNIVPIPENDRREIMQSNLDILQSHDLLKAVISKIGLERVYPGITESVGTSDSPIEVAIDRMARKHLTIKSSQQSNVIDIDALNESPEVAAEIVSTIQDMFIDRQLEIFNKPQTAFLQEQVKQSAEKLNKSQKAMRNFKSAVGISSIEAELSELLKQKSNAATVAFQSVDDAQNKLAELHDRETEMLATYRSDSPALKAIRQEIAEAKRQLDIRQKNLNIAAKDSMLSEQMVGIDKRIRELEEQRSQYNDLMRQVQTDEDNYKNYLTKSEEARINETLGEKKITSIAVVDAPSIPVKHARPRKTLMLLVSMIAGVVFGGIAVLVREVMDQRFRNPHQLLNALKLPVLATFPKKDGAMQLYNNIEHLLSDVPQPIIQFMSSYENEGVDNVTSDLANMAKKQGKNVLLINTEELRQNFQQAHFEFANRYNNSWTIIPNSGVLKDEVAQSIAKQVSGSVLVVEAERTRAPVTKEVKRLVSSVGGKIIGTVMVGRKFYIPKWLYNILYKAE